MFSTTTVGGVLAEQECIIIVLDVYKLSFSLSVRGVKNDDATDDVRDEKKTKGGRENSCEEEKKSAEKKQKKRKPRKMPKRKRAKRRAKRARKARSQAPRTRRTSCENSIVNYVKNRLEDAKIQLEF